jgi:uncharacterized protein (DUF1697 family)
MTTYIALLRGINVGGKTSLPMKDLVAAIEECGGNDVRTYIQSGNAAFESAETNASRLSKAIRSGIKDRSGFEPHVLLLSIEELSEAIAANPFPEAAETDPSKLHLGFLNSAPTKPDMAKLESLKKGNERFLLRGKAFYLHAPEGVGRSKLAAGAERALGVAMTDRNWRPVCRIREMAQRA